MRHIATTTLIAASLALIGPPAASAAGAHRAAGIQTAGAFSGSDQAVTDQYGPGPGSGTGPTGSGNTPPGSGNEPVSTAAPEDIEAVHAEGRELPFTGLDLLLIVLLGISAVATGLLMRAGIRVYRRAGLARPLG